jgi:hypothetical protein
MAEYKVGRRAAECAATNQPFAEGQEVVSAIFDAEDGFERRDYDAVAFEAVEPSYSFWRGRIPQAREEQHRLDFDLALEFFTRLVRDDEPEHLGLRFLLALLLGRKRRLKLKGFSKKDGVEYQKCLLRGDEEDEELSLEVPKLDDAGRVDLQSQLNRLFGVEEAPDSDAGAEESPDESAQDPAESPAEASAEAPAGAPRGASTEPTPPENESEQVGAGGDFAPV